MSKPGRFDFGALERALHSASRPRPPPIDTREETLAPIRRGARGHAPRGRRPTPYERPKPRKDPFAFKVGMYYGDYVQGIKIPLNASGDRYGLTSALEAVRDEYLHPLEFYAQHYDHHGDTPIITPFLDDLDGSRWPSRQQYAKLRDTVRARIVDVLGNEFKEIPPVVVLDHEWNVIDIVSNKHLTMVPNASDVKLDDILHLLFRHKDGNGYFMPAVYAPAQRPDIEKSRSFIAISTLNATCKRCKEIEDERTRARERTRALDATIVEPHGVAPRARGVAPSRARGVTIATPNDLGRWSLDVEVYDHCNGYSSAYEYVMNIKFLSEVLYIAIMYKTKPNECFERKLLEHGRGVTPVPNSEKKEWTPAIKQIVVDEYVSMCAELSVSPVPQLVIVDHNNVIIDFVGEPIVIVEDNLELPAIVIAYHHGHFYNAFFPYVPSSPRASTLSAMAAELVPSVHIPEIGMDWS